MAVTSFWYGLGMKSISNGTIDLDTDTFKAMLTTSSYTPNQDTDQFRSSVTNEITGTGYSAGGTTLTSLAITYDAATNQVRWDFDDPTWATATFTCRKLVIYKSRGGASSADDLVLWVDFGADETIAVGTFSYVVPATGQGLITVS